MIRHLTCLVVFLLFNANLSAQNTVSAKLNGNNILIGDHIKLTLDLSLQAGTKVEQIDLGVLDQSEGVELIKINDLKEIPAESSLLMMQEIILTSYDSGYHLLQAIPVIIRTNTGLDTLYSNDLAFSVNTIPVSEDNELRANKDIIEEPSNWRDYLPFLLAFLALAAIIVPAWIIANKKVKVPVKPPPPPIPAYKIALEKLAVIENEKLWESGDIKKFQSDLTYVFREYLEGRFSLNALEATTVEILEQFPSISALGPWEEDIKAILERADMVKFAKAIPTAMQHEEALSKIKAFVTTTQLKDQPKAEQTND